MRYFITSDIHSFYEPFVNELNVKGFDKNKDILIILGDLFDRGPDSKKLLDFLTTLNDLNHLILIKGNHEDLLEDCLEELKNRKEISLHHISNKTIDTISQLTDTPKEDLLEGEYDYQIIETKLKKYFKLVDQAKDYYEIDNYIFVHGWIPTINNYEDLHKCSKEEWAKARWYNGMERWNFGSTLKDKIIVCGHWNTSYGNCYYHNKGSAEFSKDADFEIFEDEGIIALDAATVFSGKVNVKVLEI
ncbi:metallophosphoesterase [uncultured Clostridium sp.]|uniref:metallophosphoesterase n=1 Tax=uncultured Clostridium sp. TaxID=59620 RepID=UPI0026255A48|nr:metallophosphoesterase [uncultured Clostridium sp.]